MIGLKGTNIEDLLFLDIETVRIQNEIEEGTPLYDSWEYKMRYSRETDKYEGMTLEESFKQKSPLYAEFAKIVCITIGRLKDGKCVLYSIANDDESAILEEFNELINGFYAKNNKTMLAGHAIKGFDIPFIMRRCLINNVEIPVLCDVAHLKPWELKCFDTTELWKGTGFYSASLINIAVAMGLPSPKSDINGAEVSDVYYTEKNGLSRIVSYCEKDVHTVCNIACRMFGLDFVESEVSIVTRKNIPPLKKKALNIELSSSDLTKLNSSLETLSDTEKIIANEIIKTI